MKRILAVFVAALCASLAGVGTAAASDRTSVDVSGGVLSLRAPSVGALEAVRLAGGATRIPLQLGDLIVTDARGSGSGWSVVVTAKTFRSDAGSALPQGSLVLDPAVVDSTETSGDAPVARRSSISIDGTTSTLAFAAAGSGMGRFRFRFPLGLELSVPSNTLPGVYRSEITFSVNSGP